MTQEQAKIVGHSLGVNVYHAQVSGKKKDKKLPAEFYRNRFCASSSHNDMPVLLELEQTGYMKPGRTINQGQDVLWYVTESGINVFKDWFFTNIQQQ